MIQGGPDQPTIDTGPYLCPNFRLEQFEQLDFHVNYITQMINLTEYICLFNLELNLEQIKGEPLIYMGQKEAIKMVLMAL